MEKRETLFEYLCRASTRSCAAEQYVAWIEGLRELNRQHGIPSPWHASGPNEAAIEDSYKLLHAMVFGEPPKRRAAHAKRKKP